MLGSDHGALDYHRGTWTASGDLMTSPDPDTALRVAFFGDSATLTLGVGPDHGGRRLRTHPRRARALLPHRQCLGAQLGVADLVELGDQL